MSDPTGKPLFTYSMSFGGGDGRTLFTIRPDGRVEFGEGVTNDDAAKAFWAAVTAHNPMRAVSEENERLRAQIALLEEELERQRDEAEDALFYERREWGERD